MNSAEYTHITALSERKEDECINRWSQHLFKQKSPIPDVMLPDIISGGFCVSTSPCNVRKDNSGTMSTKRNEHHVIILCILDKCTAMINPQLPMGPQKWVVLGPTGLFKNALKLAIRDTLCGISCNLTQLFSIRSQNTRYSVTEIWLC